MGYGRSRILWYWLIMTTGVSALLLANLTSAFPQNDGIVQGFEEESGISGARERRRQRQVGYQQEEGLLKDMISRHLASVFGMGLSHVRVYRTEDFLLIRAGGLLGPGEHVLLEYGEESGLALVKEMKTRLFESAAPKLASRITEMSGLKVNEWQASFSPGENELIAMFGIDGKEKEDGNGAGT